MPDSRVDKDILELNTMRLTRMINEIMSSDQKTSEEKAEEVVRLVEKYVLNLEVL